MPDYDYLAIDPAGKEKRGSLSADSAEDARVRLDQRKLFVVKVEPGKPKAERGRALLSLTRPKLTAKQLTLFTRQLSTLIEVSPLEEALRTISRQSEQDHVRAIVTSVHGGVTEGRRLADAMAAEAKSFPPLYRAMVSAGESSGSLPLIIDRLAELLERQAQVRG